MKSFLSILSLICSLFVSQVNAQTACDSLIIDCCNFDLFGNDTISLMVTNTNTNEIFDYPGFILLASNGDTLAIETVNYFVIGWVQQTHVLQVQNPINLPLVGTLELWGGFYDTLYCVFPISIGINGIEEISSSAAIYPNPAIESIQVQGIEQGSYTIYSMDGKNVISNKQFENSTIDLKALKAGKYIIHIESESNGFKAKIEKK